MSVEMLRRLYGWAWDDLMKLQGVRKLEEAEKNGGFRHVAAELAERLQSLPVDADNVHLVVLGRNLERVLTL
jgi:hypothetical protein